MDRKNSDGYDDDDERYDDDEGDDDFQDIVIAPINSVQLDGLVLLKIIQHCSDAVPEVVTGQLLGLDVEGILEVTSCFPLPTVANEKDDSDYQFNMMTLLRDMNVDNNTVGWYQSAYLGSYITLDFVISQVQYQTAIPNSVVIVYDPFRTTKGKLLIKAFQLTPDFLELYHKGDFSHDAFTEHDIISSEIFREIPVKVKNAHLVHGFLYELREEKVMGCEVDRLDLQAAPLLIKDLGMLCNLVDEYAGEQSKFHFYQRQVVRQKALQQQYLQKRAEENDSRRDAGLPPLATEDESKHPAFKPIPKHSRLENNLIANQIGHYCSEVVDTAVQTIGKLYLTDGLQSADRK